MNISQFKTLAAALALLLCAACEGAAGAKGPQGDAGPTGEQGVKGDKGDKGDPGEPGTPGTPGTAGEKGDKGDKGDPGAAGPAGADGVQGPIGPTGTTGEKGDKGDPGEQGVQGPAGATGTTGDKGDPGAAGPKGDKGDKGDPGATGPKGDAGAPGASTGTLRVRVVDSDTASPIANAKVEGLLGSALLGLTDGQGYFEAVVPTGIYQLHVSANKLSVTASKVLMATTTAEADSEAVSVTAGGTGALTVGLGRLNLKALNLTAVHKVGTAMYADANCIACHSDRKGQLAVDGKTLMFHALGAHNALDCTFCHVKTDINVGNWDGSTTSLARKNVEATKTCATCHKNYPAKLP